MTRTFPSVSAAGTARLLERYRYALPPDVPTPHPKVDHERVTTTRSSRRGRRARGLGWWAVEAPLATTRTTTDQVGGLYPFVASPGVPAVGAPMGYDALSGGAFYCHPVEWVLAQFATNPNVVIFGEPGRGKSSTIAAFVVRMMLFGVSTLIAGDVKGEYGPVVRALGQRPISLGYGQGTRINPLDLGPLAARWSALSREEGLDALNDLVGRWVPLLGALCQAQGHAMSATDTEVVSSVLRQLTGVTDPDSTTTALRPVTIPAVHRVLVEAAEHLWRAHRFAGRQDFLDHLRPLTDTLGTVVNGPLKGLFDAETTLDVDWTAPIQSLDLSGLEPRGDRALAVAMTCLGSWSRSATDLRVDGQLRIIVRDEIWRQMRLGAGMISAVDAELRLSRSQQIISVLAAHKPGDLHAVGDTGSQAVNIAKDLLALCDTRILMGQTTAIVDDLAAELGLSERELDLVSGWCNGRPGRGLWKVKRAGYQVQTVLSEAEKAVFDTNAQLRGRTSDAAERDTSAGQSR